MRARRLRFVAYGLAAGAALSALRAPSGLDVTQVAAPSAELAVLVRAVALAAAVLFLDPTRAAFRGRFRPTALLSLMALGYGGHGLLAPPALWPASRLGLALAAVAALAVLRLAAGPRAEDGGAPAEPTRQAPLAWLGWLLLGAGSALSLESLARHARLLGLALPCDDTLAGLAFLGLLALGAFAFGGLAADRRGDGTRLALAAAATPLATFLGLSFLATLGPDGYQRYLERFGFDVTDVGRWRPTVLIAAATFVAPAFVLGAGLGGTRAPRRWADLGIGAALGLLALPPLVAWRSAPLALSDLAGAPWAWQGELAGALVAGAGGVLALGLGPTGRRRAWALAALALALAPLVHARVPVWPFSPWHTVTIAPLVLAWTPEGLVTVEEARGSERIVTLDRRRMTPLAEDEAADALRLRLAVALLSEEERRDARVLFVGQMTPARTLAFDDLGLALPAWTVPWDGVAEAVTEALFQSELLPTGRRLSAAEARRELAAGAFDLVIAGPTWGAVLPAKSGALVPWSAPPAFGAAALAGLPEGTRAVLWQAASAELSGRALGDAVLVAPVEMQHFTVGLLGALPDPLPAGAPAALRAGAAGRARGALAHLDERADDRVRRQERETAARLAEAARGTPQEALARALAGHFASQRRSSPYESLAEQTELEEETLRDLFAAARERPLDPALRAFWEAAARLASAKRQIDKVLAYVEPLALRDAPWPALERAVASAYVEFDQPEEAALYLGRLLAASPADQALRVEAALWFERAGDRAGALRLLEEGLARSPGSAALERALLLARVRAGDPEARARAEELLARDPGDEELRELLAPGPPALPDGG